MTASGIYRIYQDGELVSEQKNLLTTVGKRELLGIVAGTSSKITRLGLGVSSGAVSTADLTLGMPLVDAPVDFSTPLVGSPSKVVYKARLSEGVTGVIHEIGAYNGPEVNEPLLINFGEEPGDSIEFATGPAGGGTDAVRCGALATVLDSHNPGTLKTNHTYLGAWRAGQVVPSDFIAIALKPTQAVVTNVTVSLYDGAGLVSNFLFQTDGTTNYQVRSLPIQFGSPPAGFNWDEIVKCVVVLSGPTNRILLDSMAVLSPTLSGSLLSHALYSTPLTKKAGVRMDIEYELTFNL